MSFGKANILAQRLARLLPARPLASGLIALALSVLGMVTAFGIAPDTVTDPVERRTVLQELAVPEFAPSAAPAQASFVNQERVQRGDTVAALFRRLEIDDDGALDFLRKDPVGRQIFRQLIPGRTMQAETGRDGELRALRYFVGGGSVLEVTRQGEAYAARERPASASPRIFYHSGTIRSSLFAATDAAGIPDAIAMQIARVFATDIDFHVDLRKGDTFAVLYEMPYEGTEAVSSGRILAAEFVNQGHAYTAVLFEDEEGNDAYYGPDGTNRAKAFLRSPVEFSRVSSGFGGRVHPIFKTWRAHTGVDFAAPKGTRVLAAADAHVTFAGWRNGYGHTLELRHGGGITTLYAHLSGFASGIRAGKRVRQGEPVAYVGATGWATGPHLHYEFKIAGIHQNPMKVALPKATPVPPHLKARFDAAAAAATERIALVRGNASLRFE